MTSGREAFHEAMAKRAVELLGDGRWHSWAAVLDELARLVPPGVALRKAETLRSQERAYRRRKGQPVNEHRQREPDTERDIRFGRHETARIWLGNRRVFETDRPGTRGAGPRDRERQVRMIAAPVGYSSSALARPQEVELREQVDRLTKYLHDIGHGSQVPGLLTPGRVRPFSNDTRSGHDQ